MRTESPDRDSGAWKVDETKRYVIIKYPPCPHHLMTREQLFLIRATRLFSSLDLWPPVNRSRMAFLQTDTKLINIQKRLPTGYKYWLPNTWVASFIINWKYIIENVRTIVFLHFYICKMIFIGSIHYFVIEFEEGLLNFFFIYNVF